MIVSNDRPSAARSSASATRNSTEMRRSAALAAARSIAAAAKSTPSTACPSPARWSAFSPVPHPASSTDPLMRPVWARRTSAPCGRPTSHVGVPPSRYALSKNPTIRRLRGERYPTRG